MEAFGRYRLVKRLGAGGMGEVFLAHAEDSDDPVVVKRILPNLTENPRFLKLFLDETRIASRLLHPNITRILELGEVDGIWFVAMEYVDGKDLRELIKRVKEMEGEIPVPVALKIAIEVARALEYAHAATDETGRSLKIVHRDVSPHNLLIGRRGEVKLIDFGVAKASNKTVHTNAGMLKGKFPYMSPEQAHGRPVDARTDVFALGIVLWELLAGRALFRGKTDADTVKAVRAAVVPDLPSIRAEVTPAIARIVNKSLRREVDRRYQTATEFREQLEQVLATFAPVHLSRWVYEYDDIDGLDDADDAVDEADVESADEATVVDEPTAHTVDRRPDRKAAPAARPASVSQDGSVARPSTNLGPQTTSFVGRVAELADLHQLFRHGERLITILGPAGTGKTRLASQFARQLLSYFREPLAPPAHRGGVWWCDLSAARDVDELCAALAQALGLPLAPSDAVTQLGHALAARGEVLVVLDTFEHLVAHASATVEKWLSAAPAARFVVASREILRVPGEHVFELPPLRGPAGGETAERSEAVQLFVERGRTARPEWDPSDEDFKAIAQVVSELDGMPLAIELAAGRLAMLTPAQLVKRLPRRFDLLVDTTRAGPRSRQSTLRAAIDWSWRLLSPLEQQMLAQLSVFKGGFSVDAAEAVVDLSAHPDADPVSTLMLLRTKSLVRAWFPLGDEQATRFGLYESIREFAREKLEASGESLAVATRHQQFMLQFAERLARNAEGDPLSLAILEVERPNLMAVAERALASKTPSDIPLRVVLALDPLLTLRGPFALHPTMVRVALEALPDDAVRPRMLALEARGRLRQARGQIAEAESDYREASTLAQSLRAEGPLGRLLAYLGGVQRVQGQRADARRSLEQAVSLLEAVDDRRMHGRALSMLAGLLIDLQETERALKLYDLALNIHRDVHDRRYEGITLSNLGVYQQSVGLLSEAKLSYQQALAIHRELRNRRSEGIAHINLGDLSRDLEEPGRALMHYSSALTIVREVGARRFEGIAQASQGVLHLQSLAVRPAETALGQALDVLRPLQDRKWVGLSLAGLAAVHALTDRLSMAETLMAEASQSLTDAQDPGFLDALDVYRGVLEVSRARGSRSESEARTLTARAQKRVAHAEAMAAPSTQHPAGAPSPAARSEHVRSALRTLKAVFAKG